MASSVAPSDSRTSTVLTNLNGPQIQCGRTGLHTYPDVTFSSPSGRRYNACPLGRQPPDCLGTAHEPQGAPGGCQASSPPEPTSLSPEPLRVHLVGLWRLRAAPLHRGSPRSGIGRERSSASQQPS
jgi:hypothetical protein